VKSEESLANVAIRIGRQPLEILLTAGILRERQRRHSEGHHRIGGHH